MIGRASGGAVTLTLASMLLLSGLWCMLLSPTTSYSRYTYNWRDSVTIPSALNWTYYFEIQEGDTLTVVIDYIKVNIPEPTRPPPVFPNMTIIVSEIVLIPIRLQTVCIYNSTGELVYEWPASGGFSQSDIELAPDRYTIVFRNHITYPIEVHAHISVRRRIVYRSLEPVGQWLSLISLPVFGLGIWASSSLKKRF